MKFNNLHLIYPNINYISYYSYSQIAYGHYWRHLNQQTVNQ